MGIQLADPRDRLDALMDPKLRNSLVSACLGQTCLVNLGGLALMFWVWRCGLVGKFKKKKESALSRLRGACEWACCSEKLTISISKQCHGDVSSTMK